MEDEVLKRTLAARLTNKLVEEIMPDEMAVDRIDRLSQWAIQALSCCPSQFTGINPIVAKL